ncbi:hypothetical protein HanXRQr2_Chr09g0375081 [Helianthus annuus]|uniref:Uncharacterized protein n=1 Tax=Helianthus annuus TaxID=4232 RepID=A0A9K3I447_HELAN|nr:hypothetical protein HanXRQr2_Chr09g0375081 [Helianthus annuus]KAJ0525103.1 hypothetical protein HanHA300_Chr09g0308161 [Helianthus annuus]KAJ0892077.1 hypothetical protein HanPSC8_Chr09g0361601 [Helianthus annuus]
MIIEKLNEQLLRLFWGFKTLTLTRSWTLGHLAIHRSHFKKVHLREMDRQRVAAIARQRQRERSGGDGGTVHRLPSATLGLQSDGGGLWWLSLYRKREAEESKGTVVGASGIRGRRPSCTHHLSFKTDRETRGHTAPTQSTTLTVVLGSPVTAPTVNSRVPIGG